jgi:hypothetical protein
VQDHNFLNFILDSKSWSGACSIVDSTVNNQTDDGFHKCLEET